MEQKNLQKLLQWISIFKCDHSNRIADKTDTANDTYACFSLPCPVLLAKLLSVLSAYICTWGFKKARLFYNT